MVRRRINLIIIFIITGPVLASFFTNCGGIESFQAEISSLDSSSDMISQKGDLKLIDGDVVLNDLILDVDTSTQMGMDQVHVSFVKEQDSFDHLIEKYEAGEIEKELLFELWPNGQVIYDYDLTFDNAQKEEVSSYIEIFNQNLLENEINVKFIQATEEQESQLIISFAFGTECRSTIGYHAENPKMILSENCLTQAGVSHLLMHVLGFGHTRGENQSSIMSYVDQNENTLDVSNNSDEVSVAPREQVLNLTASDFEALVGVYGTVNEEVEYNPFNLEKTIKTNSKNPAEESPKLENNKVLTNLPKYCDQAQRGEKFDNKGQEVTIESVMVKGALPRFILTNGDEVNCEVGDAEEVLTLPEHCEDIVVGQKYIIQGKNLDIVKSMTQGMKNESVRFVNGSKATCLSRKYVSLSNPPKYCEDIKLGSEYRINSKYYGRVEIPPKKTSEVANFLMTGSYKKTCIFRTFASIPLLPKNCVGVAPGLVFREGRKILTVKKVENTDNGQISIELKGSSIKRFCKNKVQ